MEYLLLLLPLLLGGLCCLLTGPAVMAGTMFLIIWRTDPQSLREGKPRIR